MTHDSIVATLQDLIKDSQAEKFEPNATILEEGSTSKKMYVILQGQVRVFKNYKDTRIPLALLGPGELVGELALFDSTPRSASVVATTSVVALAVSTVGLQEKLSPAWILPVLRVVVERLRVANQTLANLQNLNEFSKKAFKRDPSASHVVTGTLRFCKTLKTFLKSHKQDSSDSLPESSYLKILDEVSDTLQSDLLNSKAFVRGATTSGIIDSQSQLKITLLDEIIVFLEKLASKDSLRLPSHSCLRLIEKMISDQDQSESVKEIRISLKDNSYSSMPLYSEALADLYRVPCVFEDEKNKEIWANKSELIPFWIHMRFVKCFDYADTSL